ncbi:MAG: transposase [Candidatus Acidiferrales bacterium]
MIGTAKTLHVSHHARCNISTLKHLVAVCRLPHQDRRSAGQTGCAAHWVAEFATCHTDLAIDEPRGKEISVVADNLSAHKSRPVTDFLTAHPQVHLHFTPTCSSWLESSRAVVGRH